MNGIVEGELAADGLSGIVLAGGRSSRFGSDKAAALFRGRPQLAVVLDALAEHCRRLYVVLAPGQEPPATEPALEVRLLRDEYTDQGPLAGLLAGLSAVETDLAVVVSTDLPLLNPRLVELLASLAPGVDVVLPVVDGFEQPLLAVYRPATCLPVLTAAFERGVRRLVESMDDLTVRRVGGEALRDGDPGLFSFRNANTPAELAELERIAEGQD